MKIVSYKIKTSIQYIFPESFLDPWKSYGLTKYIKLFFSHPPTERQSETQSLFFAYSKGKSWTPNSSKMPINEHMH